MAWVELSRGKYRGFMVDGYTPSEAFLINNAHKLIKHGCLPVKELRNLENNLKYAHPGGITENSLFILFQKFKLLNLQDNCKLSLNCTTGCSDRLKCINLYYTSGRNMSSLESNVHRKIDELPMESVHKLKKEYAHDRQSRPGQHYIQNIVLFNTEIHNTTNPNNCMQNWINQLSFRIKYESDYLDFNSFQDIWSIFLGYHMDRIIRYHHDRMD